VSTYKQRRVDITVTIGGGRFGESIQEVHTLIGHRVLVDIVQNGGLAQGQATVRIYGVKLELATKLTAIGTVMNQVRGKNLIQIDAGNDGEKLNTIFAGNIDSAYAELNSMPDAPVEIVAYSAQVLAVKPAEQTSYTGPVDISKILTDLASKMGLDLQLNGVGGISLSNPKFTGSLLEQLKSAVEAVNQINFSIDNNILSVWNKGGGTTAPVTEISPATGMVGYPSFSSAGMVIKHLYLPFARMGGYARISGSEITAANGKWGIYTVAHELDALTPNGRWFTTMAMQRAV